MLGLMSIGFAAAGGGDGAGAGAVGEDAVAVLAGDHRGFFLVLLELLDRWFLPRGGSRVLAFWSSPAISWWFLAGFAICSSCTTLYRSWLACGQLQVFLICGNSEEGCEVLVQFLEHYWLSVVKDFFYVLGNLAGIFVTMFISAVAFSSFAVCICRCSFCELCLFRLMIYFDMFLLFRPATLG